MDENFAHFFINYMQSGPNFGHQLQLLHIKSIPGKQWHSITVRIHSLESNITTVDLKAEHISGDW